MSNVLDNETGRPLGEGRITHVIHWNNRRIGLVGLVEKEWLDTLATINPEETTYLDFVEAGQKLAAQLKQEVSICHLHQKSIKIIVIFDSLLHIMFSIMKFTIFYIFLGM